MNSEARVMAMPTAVLTEEKRRGRKPSETKDKGPLILFFLAEASTDSGTLVLKEKFDSEGHAEVASLTRGKPYYRVEVWQSQAVVKDGSVTVEKHPVREKS